MLLLRNINPFRTSDVLSSERLVLSGNKRSHICRSINLKGCGSTKLSVLLVLLQRSDLLNVDCRLFAYHAIIDFSLDLLVTLANFFEFFVYKSLALWHIVISFGPLARWWELVGLLTVSVGIVQLTLTIQTVRVVGKAAFVSDALDLLVFRKAFATSLSI